MNFVNALRKKIRELQRADLKTKRRWLFVTSAISMVCVVGLWILYLNLTLPRFGAPQAEATSTQAEASQGESFTDTFVRGFENIRNQFNTRWQVARDLIQKNFGVLKQEVQKQNEFSVEKNPMKPYLPEPVEPVPKTKLP